MIYFLDTEFIENGLRINLLSIGIVGADGRTFYRQNKDAEFHTAEDWVWRNVFPHLAHFQMNGIRSCQPLSCDSGLSKRSTCGADDCPWRSKAEIRDEIKEFCDIPKYGKPEFWGYYSDYDWVAFCQLFGRMIDLPKGYPMYCRDIKQWCDFIGNPELPKQSTTEHNALSDALWNKRAYDFLYEKTLKP